MELFKTSVFVLLLSLFRSVVSASVETNRTKLELHPSLHNLLWNCSFPDQIPLIFWIKDVAVNIRLSVSHHVSTNAPVYTMSQNGSLVKESLDEEISRTYHDKKQTAAIVVTCLEPDASHPYKLEGKITYEGTVYSVWPDSAHHRVRRDTANHIQDYILTPSEPINYMDSHPISNMKMLHKDIDKETLKRTKRQFEPTPFEIDVVIMGDYTIYYNWYQRQNHPHPGPRRLLALRDFRRYYTVAYNWVNLIYSNFPKFDFTVSVHVVGFVIAENYNQSVITEPHRNGIYVYGLGVLKEMESYLDNHPDFLDYDHVQLFSRWDFTEDEANTQTANKGKSYVGSMCDGSRSVSYVEELGAFNSADIAAHELGHSLGAHHDGYGNWCSKTSRMLMSIRFNPYTARSNVPSDCTVYEIKTFMLNMVNMEPECVLQRLSVPSEVPDMSGQMPGQVYSVDKQCQQVYGETSFYCRNAEIDDPDAFCYEDMYCYDIRRETCATIVPALGTQCANKSWCVHGECSYDDRALDKPDNCLFGNLPHGLFELTDTGESCEHRVISHPGDCYDDFFRAMCCDACASIRNDQEPGCEYGDRHWACHGFFCGMRIPHEDHSILYDMKCCHTCANIDTTISFWSRIRRRRPKDKNRRRSGRRRKYRKRRSRRRRRPRD